MEITELSNFEEGYADEGTDSRSRRNENIDGSVATESVNEGNIIVCLCKWLSSWVIGGRNNRYERDEFLFHHFSRMVFSRLESSDRIIRSEDLKEFFDLNELGSFATGRLVRMAKSLACLISKSDMAQNTELRAVIEEDDEPLRHLRLSHHMLKCEDPEKTFQIAEITELALKISKELVDLTIEDYQTLSVESQRDIMKSLSSG